jgi:hypothetical protein
VTVELIRWRGTVHGLRTASVTGPAPPAALGRLPEERTMVGTRSRFVSRLAPCGKIADGEDYRDQDDDGLVIWDQYYTCGCRRIRHEYHDGSGQTTATRHDRRRVDDNFGPDRGC